MDIKLLKEHWEAFAQEDPLWAVLTDPEQRGGRWDVSEFLATGERDVAAVFDDLERAGVAVARGRALDFGCGVGRLTQALGERFERCDGIDIAPSMIEQARRLNRHGERCRYHVGDGPRLDRFPAESFDFVLSLIVLQHMEPRYATGYIAEFVRVLRPGGIALFQVPSAMSEPAPPPLPESAFRAELSLQDDVGPLRPGERRDLAVRVRNASASGWPAGGQVRLGNHWFAADGEVLTLNDGRSELAGELAAGAATSVALTVTAPPDTGRYTLVVDLVQEQIAWFAQRGSERLRVPVEVAGEPTAHVAPAEDPFARPMEMYAVSRAQVIATVEDAGGRVLAALPDTSAGSSFESYRYIVRREPVVRRESLEQLSAALRRIPDRPDLLPPVIVRRAGTLGRLEAGLKHSVARGSRWFTWMQGEHNRAVADALVQTRAVVVELEAEIRELRAELEHLRERR